jgi:hypothetical protein
MRCHYTQSFFQTGARDKRIASFCCQSQSKQRQKVTILVINQRSSLEIDLPLEALQSIVLGQHHQNLRDQTHRVSQHLRIDRHHDTTPGDHLRPISQNQDTATIAVDVDLIIIAI